MIHILLKLLFAAPLERQPMALHQEPHHLDAVEIGAVGWQELQRHPLLLQQFECRLGLAGPVNRRVAEHDHHRLAGLLRQLRNKNQGDLCGAAASPAGMHHLATAEQRSHHVQALTARGINAVLFATGCPYAVVGVNLRETSLVIPGRHAVSRLYRSAVFEKPIGNFYGAT